MASTVLLVLDMVDFVTELSLEFEMGLASGGEISGLSVSLAGQPAPTAAPSFEAFSQEQRRSAGAAVLQLLGGVEGVKRSERALALGHRWKVFVVGHVEHGRLPSLLQGDNKWPTLQLSDSSETPVAQKLHVKREKLCGSSSKN